MATDIHDIINVAGQLRQLNLEVPGPLLGVVAAHEGVQTAMRVDSLQPLRDDIENGLIDVDTITERIGILGGQIAAQQQSQRVAIELAPSFDRAARRHLAAAHDQIIESLRPVFDANVQAIANANELLGDLMFNAVEIMTKLGPAGATAYNAFDSANQSINKVLKVVRIAYTAVDADFGPVDSSAFIDGAKADYRRAQPIWNAERKITGLVRNKIACRVNTISEAKQIIERATASSVAAEAAQRAQQLAATQGDADREMRGLGITATNNIPVPVRSGGTKKG